MNQRLFTSQTRHNVSGGVEVIVEVGESLNVSHKGPPLPTRVDESEAKFYSSEYLPCILFIVLNSLTFGNAKVWIGASLNLGVCQ